jgi:dienelactone hydrolase
VKRLSGALAAVFLAAALVVPAALAAEPRTAGPLGAPSGPEREQVWWVPITPPRAEAPLHLVTTVYRPPGDGPFPLAIINHGSPRDAADRRKQQRNPMRAPSRWFVGRGFAVAVPMRRGYGASEGDFSEGFGPCNAADFYAGGRASAADIGAVLAYFRNQAFVDPNRIVLVGQSAGGWGVLAAATENPEGVAAIVNFAGGRGSPAPDENCSALRPIETAGVFGRTARIPSLWIYTENDRYIGPALSTRMAAAFRDSGGRAEFHLLPPFGSDGHALFARAVERWAPLVQPFLAAHGLMR